MTEPRGACQTPLNPLTIPHTVQNPMIQHTIQILEIAALKGTVKRLEAENRELQRTIDKLQRDLETMNLSQFNRQADFLDVALKTMVTNGTITINDDRNSEPL